MVLSAHSPSQNGNATFGDTSLERDRREFARCHYPKHVNQAHKAWVADQVYLVARAGHGGAAGGGTFFGGGLPPDADPKRTVKNRPAPSPTPQRTPAHPPQSPHPPHTP